MAVLSELVPIPSKDVLNIGLTSAREDTMLGTFGLPGELTLKCSTPAAAIAPRMVRRVDVGPFAVSGLRLAVDSLRLVFAEISRIAPQAYDLVKSAGMLCVRARRHNPAHYSNHSWGTAIDLYFGTAVVPQGTPYCQRGILELYGAFNRNGWYWGAEFSSDSVDTMHFEVAEETILKWGHIAPELAAMEPGTRPRVSSSRRRGARARGGSPG